MSDREPPNIGLAKCCFYCIYWTVHSGRCTKLKCQVTQVNVCDDYEPETSDESR